MTCVVVGKFWLSTQCQTDNRLEIHCQSSSKISSQPSIGIRNKCEGHGIFETKLYALLD
jgi:hypothetical protein